MVKSGETSKSNIDADDNLYFHNRLFVPNDLQLKQSILNEAHSNVKAEHQVPSGLLQPIMRVCNYGLCIKVTVDTKKKRCNMGISRSVNEVRTFYTQLYISEIIRLHGVPSSIIFDRDSRFTSSFWSKLHEVLDTKLKFITTFHSQMDGQSER
ncbi:integrase [Gossypium australe]|uniref:Integrase n=1 Tax=Gossypium australe TaxID=47621 RepID=A0A5B6WSM9_9ROSI|nr:integrase [Gossypium australe]